MLFNTPAFIFAYLPVVFAGAFLAGRVSHRFAVLWLGLCSLAFYAVWDVRFVLLLLCSITFNYGASYWILARRRSGGPASPLPLVVAITINLAALCYFKYANFFIASFNRWLGTSLPVLDVVLPLGISFFTFTQIAFLVDVHRGIAREYSFVSYLLFVTYFPHLIAGPVLHHSQMMPQFADARTLRVNPGNIAVGLTTFILGLGKKVLLADMLAPHATAVFDLATQRPENLHMIQAWLGALAYTLQLYFDFSGYSDMAIGLSLLFNIRLPLNFNSPYKASSMIDFWRRWHMTLSEFLRAYLYVPLGGNRKGTARRYLNLMITMLLGGLWHGAGWTYVFWGALHGAYLMVNHGWRAFQARYPSRPALRLPRTLSGAITFLAVVIAWVFFRASSLHAARSMLLSMVGANGISVPHALAGALGPIAAKAPRLRLAFDGLAPGGTTSPGAALTLIVVGLALVWLFPNVSELMSGLRAASSGEPAIAAHAQRSRMRIPFENLEWRLTPPFAMLAATTFLVSVLFMLSSKVSEFLYFQF